MQEAQAISKLDFEYLCNNHLSSCLPSWLALVSSLEVRVGKQTWVTTKLVAESNTNKNVMTKILTNDSTNTNTREKSKKANLGPLIRQRRRWWWLDLGGRGLLGHNDRHQVVRLLLVGGQVP